MEVIFKMLKVIYTQQTGAQISVVYSGANLTLEKALKEFDNFYYIGKRKAINADNLKDVIF
jgi:hypothetical protein